jgi:uncharacterized protein
LRERAGFSSLVEQLDRYLLIVGYTLTGPKSKEPRIEAQIERPITLHMMGDWGIANLHRICGRISAELWRRSQPGSKFATWAGRGGTDAIDAVLDGEVQIALFVPAGFARTVCDGKGISKRCDVTRLRARNLAARRSAGASD